MRRAIDWSSLDIDPQVSAASTTVIADFAEHDGNTIPSGAEITREGDEEISDRAVTGPYQGGRSKHWVKVKNRQHPAMSRVEDGLW
jgi:hypothetical protein